jgi:YesN/AraC family two-component response regulator
MMAKNKLKVFIADDSSFINDRLPGLLAEISGVEVIGKARDGDEALNSIVKLDPDVVILDIRMPGKNGIEVLAELKKGNPKLKVIILTNYPYPQYKQKCTELGAEYFFEKSNDFEKLFNVLKEMSKNA